MTKPKNERYKVVAHISDYLEKAFLQKKEIVEKETGKKYFRLRFFEEVADYCGIKSTTLSQMHQRNLLPSYIVAIKMSEYLNVPVTDIWQVVDGLEGGE